MPRQDYNGFLVARKTCDAFSRDNYASREWYKLADWLGEQGLTEAQAEAILRSKLTRWAGDSAPAEREWGEHTAEDFISCWASTLKQKVAEIMAED